MQNKGGVFSDDFGLRSPVIQETFFSDEISYLYRFIFEGVCTRDIRYIYTGGGWNKIKSYLFRDIHYW